MHPISDLRKASRFFAQITFQNRQPASVSRLIVASCWQDFPSTEVDDVSRLPVLRISVEFIILHTPHIFRMRTLVLLFALVLTSLPNTAISATIAAIVSSRNAADVVTGAHQFLRLHPDHLLKLKTTSQFVEMSQKQQKQWLESSDLVFAGGVFGAAGENLLSVLREDWLKNFIAVHSDRRLVSLSRFAGQSMLTGADLNQLMTDPPIDGEPQLWTADLLEKHTAHRPWLMTRLFWSGRSPENMTHLFTHLAALTGENIAVASPMPLAPVRVYYRKSVYNVSKFSELLSQDDKRWVVILDYETGDRLGSVELLQSICGQFQGTNTNCVSLLATWGDASVAAVNTLRQNRSKIALIVSLQNFVIGGGEGRAEVNAALNNIGIPILKGIRLTDRTEQTWRLSEDGLAWDSVHYRVAMSEIQGIAEPTVLSVNTVPRIDELTGIRITQQRTLEDQTLRFVRRIKNWIALQQKSNADKKIAIIYYNHPPGRHNIGADNLNVPATVFDLLHDLKSNGYNVGELPDSEEQLLDLLQERAVNLPEDNEALVAMSQQVVNVSVDQYQNWYQKLPEPLQQELENGPFGYLNSVLKKMSGSTWDDGGEMANSLGMRVIEDLRHIVDGADHPARQRVLNLMDQLEAVYSQDQDDIDWTEAQNLIEAIAGSGIEGLRGWGKPPGQIMVHNGSMVLPGIQFGNIFLGPQPPRGWELDEELLHANLSFPPPHQYLALYMWLRNQFKADAVVHLGRHSTYEFLPRHRVGLSVEDYPVAVLGELPSVYPYIVDGVGEGIQAKRRGLAVIVDHLTPPLDSTLLYDRLLELRQLVESYESSSHANEALRSRTVNGIKELVTELNLEAELIESMADLLSIRGITEFDQIDNELLVHEVGHYLTKLQEQFMPLGLHTFGRDWSDEALDTMVRSMSKGIGSNQGSEVPEESAVQDSIDWRELLRISPAAETSALLAGLDGKYIAPGKGNDPIRTPEVLPTGRNFFALDGSLIPSPTGYQLGAEMAMTARLGDPVTPLVGDKAPDSKALVLWASDTVRDEGAMIAFGFDMLGLKPIWNSRGIFKGLERLEIDKMLEGDEPRKRHDMVFTTSGLFRDLYGAQLVWLERAVLMALDASAIRILQNYPALTVSLSHALEPLGNLQNPGQEPLTINLVAARWVKDARKGLAAGASPLQAGKEAAYRVFGAPPGAYGAGVNRMVERSGSWEQRQEVAQVYLNRMGHVYGAELSGEPRQGVFQDRLTTVSKTYLGRASNLYGVLDNNDSFDYLGGLSLAIETQRGKAPDNYILVHTDSNNYSVEPLQAALLRELRGQHLNPQWLQPLMEEGYAGARTMGSEFLEYLWGWQVTNPGIVKSWVWDEVKSVYLDDRLELGLDEFLEQGHNVHVMTNMLAIMLVSAQKEFWDASKETISEIAEKFTDLILANGLPGSGHTNPSHPLYEWLEEYVSVEKYEQLQAVTEAAQVDYQVAQGPAEISEILVQPEQAVEPIATEQPTEEQLEPVNESPLPVPPIYVLIAACLTLVAIGWFIGTRDNRALA